MEKETLKTIFEFLEEKGEHTAPIKWKLINNIPFRKENLDIKITESYGINVNYQVTIDGYLIEIEGILNQIGSERNARDEFEVYYFMNDVAEMYYDLFWEEIEDEIVDKFYSK